MVFIELRQPRLTLRISQITFSDDIDIFLRASTADRDTNITIAPVILAFIVAVTLYAGLRILPLLMYFITPYTYGHRIFQWIAVIEIYHLLIYDLISYRHYASQR